MANRSAQKQTGKSAGEPFQTTDSLIQAIRNSKEADIFLAELQAAAQVASRKKN